MSSIWRRLSGANSVEKPDFQVAAEQGANPRPGDAKRVAVGCIRTRVQRCRRAIRAPRPARSRCGPAPARRRACHSSRCRTRGSMDVSSSTLPGVRSGGTVLSRFCARAFPCLFCRRGFAASMPPARFRAADAVICVVNVKFTNLHRPRSSRRPRRKIRHPPRKRGIEYAAASRSVAGASEYWVARSSRAMTAVDGTAPLTRCRGIARSVILRESGGSSTPRPFGQSLALRNTGSPGQARLSRAMTAAVGDARHCC